MLTTRSLLLTCAGLLTGFAAAAQATPAAGPTGPQPTDILSWAAWCLAGVVLLLAIINGASVTLAAQRTYQEEEGAALPTPATTAQPEPAPAARPARTTVAAHAEAIAA